MILGLYCKKFKIWRPNQSSKNKTTMKILYSPKFEGDSILEPFVFIELKTVRAHIRAQARKERRIIQRQTLEYDLVLFRDTPIFGPNQKLGHRLGRAVCLLLSSGRHGHSVHFYVSFLRLIRETTVFGHAWIHASVFLTHLGDLQWAVFV